MKSDSLLFACCKQFMVQCRSNQVNSKELVSTSCAATIVTTTPTCAWVHSCAQSQCVGACMYRKRTVCMLVCWCSEADYEQSLDKVFQSCQLSVAGSKVGYGLVALCGSPSPTLILSLPGLYCSVKQAGTSFGLSPASHFCCDSLMQPRDR